MSSTSERLLPATWALTAGEVAALSGRPLDEWASRPTPGTVLVADVEGLCRGALAENRYRDWVRDLTPGDWHEVMGFLLGQVAVRARGYDPGRRGIEFRPWLYNHLRSHDVEDARRWLYGRDGRHRIPEDHLAETLQRRREAMPGVDFGDEPAVRDRLDEASLADPADRVDARRWIDSEADRGDARDGGVAGGGSGGRAPLGDRRPGVGAGRGAAGGVGRPPFVDCLTCGWRTFLQAPNGYPGWHIPEACSGCGADLPAGVAA